MSAAWNHLTPLASLAGGVLCGVGRGVAGFCPSPARGAVGSGSGAALQFSAATVADMLLHDNAWARRQRKVASA